VISLGVVILDEPTDLKFEFSRHVVMLQLDLLLQLYYFTTGRFPNRISLEPFLASLQKILTPLNLKIYTKTLRKALTSNK